ncbi:MAG: hypothetical protein ACFFDW_09585 [Candidatus Thorarchaeota archaeon]
MQRLLCINVNCPYCGNSLMKYHNEKHSSCIEMKIETLDNSGTIELCSAYCNNEFFSDIDISSEVEYTFRCPHCNNILNTNEKCDFCSSTLVRLHVIEGGFVEFCSKAKCQKPSIQFENFENAVEHFYELFRFG